MKIMTCNTYIYIKKLIVRIFNIKITDLNLTNTPVVINYNNKAIAKFTSFVEITEFNKPFKEGMIQDSIRKMSKTFYEQGLYRIEFEERENNKYYRIELEVVKP